MSTKPLLALAAMLLLSPGFPGGLAMAAAAAAETPAAASAPAAPAPPAAPPATVTGTVEQTTASEELQRAALARLEQAERWRELAQRIAVLEAELDALAAGWTP